MSDNTAGGPPPEENEPPQRPDPGAQPPGEPAPQPPAQQPPVPPQEQPPVQPSSPVPPGGQPPAQPSPPVQPGGQPPAQPGPPAAPPYGAPAPPPAAAPYGAPAGGQTPASPPPGGGGYPPPGGAYPPAGAYPPPGQPTHAGAAPFSVGDAIGFGWRRFWANPWPWILLMLIVLLVNVIFGWISGGVDRFSDYRTDGWTDTNMAEALGLSFVNVLVSIVGIVISYLIAALYARGALDESQARKPDVSAFFRITNVGNVLLAAFLVAVMTIVGTILCILPGIAVAIFSVFVYFFTLDKEQDAITAIKSSWSLVAKNFGSVFLLLLALFGINILGFLVCFVGLLVTLPLSYIALAYAYRRLVGEQPV